MNGYVPLCKPPIELKIEPPLVKKEPSPCLELCTGLGGGGRSERARFDGVLQNSNHYEVDNTVRS